MSVTRYTGSYSGIGMLLRSDFMKAEMLRRAERIMGAAQALAPNDDDMKNDGWGEDMHAGRYAESFTAVARMKQSAIRGQQRGRVAAGTVRAAASPPVSATL